MPIKKLAGLRHRICRQHVPLKGQAFTKLHSVANLKARNLQRTLVLKLTNTTQPLNVLIIPTINTTVT